MKQSLILSLILLFSCYSIIYGQVIIGSNSSAADSSAILELKSTDKGFLPPRMTLAQRSLITDPADGLVIYCTDCGQNRTPTLSVFIAGMWNNLYGCIPPAKPTAATHIACPTQINWTWHPVAGAQGYLWSDSQEGEFLDLGTDTSKLETGLVSNTVYSWYVWAYNSCGRSAPANLTVSTAPDVMDPPQAGVNEPLALQITWKWHTVEEASGYMWNSENNYATAMDIGTDTVHTQTGLICETEYTSYTWTYNECGHSLSRILLDTTQAEAPATPVAATSIPAIHQVNWKWHPVEGASGYKWNYVDNYETALDLGTDTTYLEGSLDCESQYTRYAWAYGSCGVSVSVPLIQSTTACWECGISITISHVQGNVAPVTKTSVYGTVNNVPGETTKCWITSNLGSDHQATAVNDNTEASAGWYWQFNRLQGYKHDGSARTPNTSWINNISEYLSWTAENDPCTSQMGLPWRIPTATEWVNVDGVGGWSTWNGPWNSLLKMHAAGYLYYNDGSLMARGSDGAYWSSSMANNTTGRDLYFLSTGSSLSSHPKAFGFTVRCIREP